MAVTQAQAKQAHDASFQVMQAAQAMLLYTNRVTALFDGAFTVKVGDETITLAQDVQDRLIDVAKYNALKANLVTAFNLLP